MENEALPEKVDVLIVGSGVAGLATAISAKYFGAQPIVIEKSEYYGGSTALSGGAIWCPANHLMLAAGMEDSVEKAKDYLKHECGELFNEELVDSFLGNAPEAIRFFHEQTHVKLKHRPFSPDYHPNIEGALQGGRVLDPEEFDGRLLGDRLYQLRPPIKEFTVLNGLQLGRQDLVHFTKMTRNFQSLYWVLKTVMKYYYDVAKYGRYTKIKMGAALVARLAYTAFHQKIPILTNHQLLKINKSEAGIKSVQIKTQQGEKEVFISKGLVLAGGGYPHNTERKWTTYGHLRQGFEHYSMAPDSSTGDTIQVAERIGAQFLSTNSNPVSWTPVSKIPQEGGGYRYFPHLFMDRAKPGVIAISSSGKRFVNEAVSYHDFVQEMIKNCQEEGSKSCWLVSDAQSLRKYGLGAVPCFPGRISPYIKSGYLIEADSVKDLAKKLKINYDTLRETIDRYNSHAKKGIDLDFGKGGNSYQQALGDIENSPNACLKPIENKFYAVQLFPGDIGTTMGLDVNASGQVKDRQGKVIPKLYAVGNDANSVMSGAYPGAGITLGPALTFGYLIGKSLGLGKK